MSSRRMPTYASPSGSPLRRTRTVWMPSGATVQPTILTAPRNGAMARPFANAGRSISSRMPLRCGIGANDCTTA